MSRQLPRSNRSSSSNSSSKSSYESKSSISNRRPSTSTKHVQPVQQISQVASPAETGEWLAKALASSGVASRRACIDLVKSGKVQVNGAVVKDPATKVNLSADKLAVNGRPLSTAAASTLCHFAVHKPVGYICSNVSRQPGMRAIDLLQPYLDSWQQKHKGQLPPRLFTVGRLDVATSGLLFVTNDGSWANQVIHPSADITKEYWVTLLQEPTPQQLQLLRAGTEIEGVPVVPKVAKILQSSSAAATAGGQGSAAAAAAAAGGGRRGSSSRGGGGDSRGRCVLRLDVSEGKKHEVRLLVAAAGLKLLQLKRVRVGGFVMPNSLLPGQYMELSAPVRAKVTSAPC